jgi:hypothetical protein
MEGGVISRLQNHDLALSADGNHILNSDMTSATAALFPSEGFAGMAGPNPLEVSHQDRVQGFIAVGPLTWSRRFCSPLPENCGRNPHICQDRYHCESADNVPI